MQSSSSKRIALLGASGGIGSALVSHLTQRNDVSDIYGTYHRSLAGGSAISASSYGSAVETHWSAVDATDETEIADWVVSIGKVDWIINCVGMLHDGESGPEKSISALDPAHFERSMRVNCLPTLLLAKYARPALQGAEQGVFATISARVGSISDNRLGGWYSYRASKAALNMSLKCLAIEWGRSSKHIRVVALHPGTTDTRLSKPFQTNVKPGRLFEPEKTAALLLEQIGRLHESPSGRFIAYDGEEIGW